MAKNEVLNVSGLLAKKEREILDAWTKAQADLPVFQKGVVTQKQLKEESAQFLKVLFKALASGNLEDITAPEYEEANKFLSNISLSRASSGFTPSETATYIFSLKDAVLKFLQGEFSNQPEVLNKAIMQFSSLLDKLGLLTFEAYVRGREKIIREQQKSLLELSTPVIQAWDEILIMPIIGTIDSARAKQIMESLLNSIVATKSSAIIMDITGVPVVDTEVANRLLRTMQAAKLMGAETILTGLSPLISQTIVHLGIDLSNLVTRASLKEGLEMAFKKLKLKVTKMEG